MPQIKIDNTRDELLTDVAKTLLKEHYLLPDGETIQEAFARASTAYCYGDYDLAQRIYEYASKGWFMFASPVLSNAPKYGEKTKGLPISCFLTYVEDNLHSLIEHTAEERWMSVKGGGVGGHWSSVRSASNKAPGAIPFLRTIDSDMLAFSQATTRRGSYAAYLDVSHPDIEEFISFRLPTGGDINRKCLNLHNAVNITDKFLTAVYEDLDWDLIDPHSKEIKQTVKARKLWERILEIRYRTGEPYINNLDEANRHLPQSLKEKGLTINGSNLCNEIHLPTSPDRSAVCCLSSLNLEKWEEWKDTSIVEDLIAFLDNVLQFYIDNAPDELSKSKYSATRERSLGLGTMGFHYLLQSKNLSFGSNDAKHLNKLIFHNINYKAKVRSSELGMIKGNYPDYTGVGFCRNSHLIAIAPNANNSIILNTSPSIEPLSGNAYTQKTRIGTHLIKNKYLEGLLTEKGYNNKKVWEAIVSDGGSVQQLPFLSEAEKEVFRTANEIPQEDLIDQARIRQSYICQGQSVNLFFKSGADKAYVNKIHLRAFNPKGVGSPLKGLYYLRTENSQKVDKLSEKKERIALEDFKESDIIPVEVTRNTAISCVGCEG